MISACTFTRRWNPTLFKNAMFIGNRNHILNKWWLTHPQIADSFKLYMVRFRCLHASVMAMAPVLWPSGLVRVMFHAMSQPALFKVLKTSSFNLACWICQSLIDWKLVMLEGF